MCERVYSQARESQVLPSRFFWYINAEKRFPPFTKLCSFRDKAESVEVHICTANDNDETLARSDEIVIEDISFNAC
jgi:hypothetical protein